MACKISKDAGTTLIEKGDCRGIKQIKVEQNGTARRSELILIPRWQASEAVAIVQTSLQKVPLPEDEPSQPRTKQIEAMLGTHPISLFASMLYQLRRTE